MTDVDKSRALDNIRFEEYYSGEFALLVMHPLGVPGSKLDRWKMADSSLKIDTCGAAHAQLRQLAVDDLRQVNVDKMKDAEVALPVVGFGWGQCVNLTGEVLIVYGPRVAGEPFDNSPYCLPSGYVTPNYWDCDGFYVPNDRIANQLFSRVAGPLAIKYIDFRMFVIDKSAANEYRCYANNGAFRPGEINWYIPSVPYSAVQAACGS